MRLRKNMKRTAAAVLALSMAVSAVAAPASAAYICDVSKGNVEISVGPDGGKPTITVGGVAVEKSEDDSDDIIITGDNTGDNTKPTESLNAEEENTSEAEKSGENTSEVEKSGGPRPRARIRPRTLPPRVRPRAMSPPLRSCWPRRTRRRRTSRRRPTRSPPKRRRRSRTKRPPIR